MQVRKNLETPHIIKIHILPIFTHIGQESEADMVSCVTNCEYNLFPQRMYVDKLKHIFCSVTFGRLNLNINFNRERQNLVTVHFANV